MERVATGFGAGKVILLGEHAVVHGTPAIAAGLGRGVTSVAFPSDHDSLHIAPWERTVCADANGDDALARAFASVLSLYPERPPLRLDVWVGLAPGAGLGSSAAIGVSILDAIDRSLGIRGTRATLSERALEWERFFHGAPSGVDNAASALGGLIRFDRTSGASRLLPAAPLHLVVAHSGERSNTKEMVARVTQQLAEQPRRTRSRFAKVETLVARAERAILHGDLVTLGRQLDRNHQVLRELGLSTHRVEKLREDAMSAGALGAKVTGAGGGGCIVALAESATDAKSIATALGAYAFVEEVPRAA